METRPTAIELTEEEVNQILADEAADVDEVIDEYAAFAAEEESGGSPEQVAREDTARFFERHKPMYKGEPVAGKKYNPREHSSTFNAETQEGYYVYYSFPTYSRTPVASFWTYRPAEGKYSFEHIDLAKVMSLFLKHYRERGDVPPPKKQV